MRDSDSLPPNDLAHRKTPLQPPQSDTLTLLRTKGSLLATKRIARTATGEWVIQGYDRAKRFSITERTVANVYDLGAALESVSRDSRTFLVRGRPAEGIDRSDT